jgi:hypothetical protein
MSFYDKLASVQNDAIDVAPPSEYVDGGFGLPPEATYEVLIKDFEPVFDDDGTFRNRINLKRLEIVGVPNEDLRKQLGRNLTNISVFTATYQRNGATASGLGDLIRGIDDELAWSGLKEAVDIIQDAVDKQSPIQAKFIWGAFDKDGYEAGGGPQMVNKSPEQKELRKKASVRGMRNFKALPDGSYSPETTGPLSGSVLEARLELDRTIPKRKRQTMLSGA